MTISFQFLEYGEGCAYFYYTKQYEYQSIDSTHMVTSLGYNYGYSYTVYENKPVIATTFDSLHGIAKITELTPGKTYNNDESTITMDIPSIIVPTVFASFGSPSLNYSSNEITVNFTYPTEITSGTSLQLSVANYNSGTRTTTTVTPTIVSGDQYSFTVSNLVNGPRNVSISISAVDSNGSTVYYTPISTCLAIDMSGYTLVTDISSFGTIQKITSAVTITDISAFTLTTSTNLDIYTIIPLNSTYRYGPQILPSSTTAILGSWPQEYTYVYSIPWVGGTHLLLLNKTTNTYMIFEMLTYDIATGCELVDRADGSKVLQWNETANLPTVKIRTYNKPVRDSWGMGWHYETVTEPFPYYKLSHRTDISNNGTVWNIPVTVHDDIVTISLADEYANGLVAYRPMHVIIDRVENYISTDNTPQLKYNREFSTSSKAVYTILPYKYISYNNLEDTQPSLIADKLVSIAYGQTTLTTTVSATDLYYSIGSMSLTIYNLPSIPTGFSLQFTITYKYNQYEDRTLLLELPSHNTLFHSVYGTIVDGFAPYSSLCNYSLKYNEPQDTSLLYKQGLSGWELYNNVAFDACSNSLCIYDIDASSSTIFKYNNTTFTILSRPVELYDPVYAYMTNIVQAYLSKISTPSIYPTLNNLHLFRNNDDTEALVLYAYRINTDGTITTLPSFNLNTTITTVNFGHGVQYKEQEITRGYGSDIEGPGKYIYVLQYNDVTLVRSHNYYVPDTLEWVSTSLTQIQLRMIPAYPIKNINKHTFDVSGDIITIDYFLSLPYGGVNLQFHGNELSKLKWDMHIPSINPTFTLSAGPPLISGNFNDYGTLSFSITYFSPKPIANVVTLTDADTAISYTIQNNKIIFTCSPTYQRVDFVAYNSDTDYAIGSFYPYSYMPNRVEKSNGVISFYDSWDESTYTIRRVDAFDRTATGDPIPYTIRTISPTSRYLDISYNSADTSLAFRIEKTGVTTYYYYTDNDITDNDMTLILAGSNDAATKKSAITTKISDIVTSGVSRIIDIGPVDATALCSSTVARANLANKRVSVVAVANGGSVAMPLGGFSSDVLYFPGAAGDSWTLTRPGDSSITVAFDNAGVMSIGGVEQPMGSPVSINGISYIVVGNGSGVLQKVQTVDLSVNSVGITDAAIHVSGISNFVADDFTVSGGGSNWQMTASGDMALFTGLQSNSLITITCAPVAYTSASVTLTTLSAPAPSPPTYTVAVGDGTIYITDISAAGAVSYNLATIDQGTTQGPVSHIVSGDMCTVTGLRNIQKYAISVTAVNADGIESTPTYKEATPYNVTTIGQRMSAVNSGMLSKTGFDQKIADIAAVAPAVITLPNPVNAGSLFTNIASGVDLSGKTVTVIAVNTGQTVSLPDAIPTDVLYFPGSVGTAYTIVAGGIEYAVSFPASGAAVEIAGTPYNLGDQITLNGVVYNVVGSGSFALEPIVSPSQLSVSIDSTAQTTASFSIAGAVDGNVDLTTVQIELVQLIAADGQLSEVTSACSITSIDNWLVTVSGFTAGSTYNVYFSALGHTISPAVNFTTEAISLSIGAPIIDETSETSGSQINIMFTVNTPTRGEIIGNELYIYEGYDVDNNILSTQIGDSIPIESGVLLNLMPYYLNNQQEYYFTIKTRVYDSETDTTFTSFDSSVITFTYTAPVLLPQYYGDITPERFLIGFSNDPAVSFTDISVASLTDADGNTPSYTSGPDEFLQSFYISDLPEGTFYVVFSANGYTNSDPFELVVPAADIQVTLSTPIVTYSEIYCTLSPAPPTISVFTTDPWLGPREYSAIEYDSGSGAVRIYNIGSGIENTFIPVASGYSIPIITATSLLPTVELADSQLIVSWDICAGYTYDLEVSLVADNSQVALLEGVTESPTVIDSLANRTPYFLYIRETPASGTLSRCFVGQYILQQELIKPNKYSISNNNSSISVTWPYDTHAASYKVSVYRDSTFIKEDAVVAIQSVGGVLGNVTVLNSIKYINHTVIGLTIGFTYTMTITAVAEQDQTWYIDTVGDSFTATPIAPPAAPVVSLVASDASSITVSYNAVDTATAYIIYYMGQNATTYSAATRNATGTSYTITGLSAGSYKIKVVAKRVIVESADSNIIDGIVQVAGTAAQAATSAVAASATAAAAASTQAEKLSVKAAIDVALKSAAAANAPGSTIRGALLTDAQALLLAPTTILPPGSTPPPTRALEVKDGDTVKFDSSISEKSFYIPLAAGQSVTLSDSNGANATLLKTIEEGGVKKIEITDVATDNKQTILIGKGCMIAGKFRYIVGFGSVLFADAEAPILSNPIVSPTSVTYTISANQIPGADLTDVYYKLYVYAADGVTQVGQPVQTNGTADTLTSVTFNGLTAGQTYKFAAAITTSDGSGVGPLSALQDPYSVPAQAPVCFFADAPVLTPRGYRPIASFKIGDAVQTADGRTVHVTRVFMKRYVANASTLPYKIPKGVLGATRDLPISPNHEVAVSGRRMVRARDLGLQQMSAATTGRVLTYYNLELEDWVRDNMVVAGVTVESLAPIRRIEMTKTEFQAFIAQRYPTVELQGRLRRLVAMTEKGTVKCPLFMI